jgi:hypothetical protein
VQRWHREYRPLPPPGIAAAAVVGFDQRLIQRFAQSFRAGDRRGGDPTLGQRAAERFLPRTMLNIPEQLRSALRISPSRNTSRGISAMLASWNSNCV